MNNQTKPLTPSTVGLTLAVLSGPRGSVRDDWQCIEYTCQLSDSRRRVIWTGEYRLGIGHVKIANYKPGMLASMKAHLTDREEIMLQSWKAKPHASFTDKALQANAAAKLAIIQKVAPSLDDVCASLLSDGSAFFDGERFEEWAANLGYSDDSIKAKETFETCDRIGRDLSRALSRDELAGLREWASQY